MLVRVAIDLALDRLFDYEVPEVLEKKLAVGQLLSVPFGHREARGFSVEISGEGSITTDGRKLKSVTAIVDETPFFSPSLLTLVRLIASYTAAPLESVLKAALPAAVLKKNARAKEQLFVSPLPAKQEVVGALTKRQKWLYENIVRLDGGWLAPLCAELKTTPASLRALASKSVVDIAARARRRDPMGGRRVVPSRPLPLNEEQAAALEAIKGLAELAAEERASAPRSSRTILLHGVTGSGKTEVYLQAIAAELEKGRGAIVMVPEIALTPQTVQRFASRFGDKVAVLHSALSDGERYDEWHRIRRGDARVVVGPRSAVFAPVANLGLVVVDEEHEPSYKQEDNPRYHARDVAVLRGSIEGAAVVLGSATPSLETWMNVRRGKYSCATMTRRAGLGSLPIVHLVNMQEEPRRSFFSGALLDAIRLRLERGEQTILFLNRRGWSRSVTCEACGRVITCPSCDLAYTYHRVDDCLRCHVCGGWRPVPRTCPACGAAALTFRGTGTQRIEATLAKCFPQASILRMDADSTSRSRSHDDILSAFRRGEAQILVGTQMIAKGLDFPNVTLVGVLNADSSLNMPDFRASERTYQLISQVAGRAGRAELPGEVVVQCFDPSALAITAAAKGDYSMFAERELKDREENFFPPFCHLAVVTLKSQDLKLVSTWSDMYAKSFSAFAEKNHAFGLVVSDAVPSVLEKADGWYRWQIVLRAKSAKAIVAAWRTIQSHRPPPKSLRFAIDVDAHNLA